MLWTEMVVESKLKSKSRNSQSAFMLHNLLSARPWPGQPNKTGLAGLAWLGSLGCLGWPWLGWLAGRPGYLGWLGRPAGWQYEGFLCIWIRVYSARLFFWLRTEKNSSWDQFFPIRVYSARPRTEFIRQLSSLFGQFRVYSATLEFIRRPNKL